MINQDVNEDVNAPHCWRDLVHDPGRILVPMNECMCCAGWVQSQSGPWKSAEAASRPRLGLEQVCFGCGRSPLQSADSGPFDVIDRHLHRAAQQSRRLSQVSDANLRPTGKGQPQPASVGSTLAPSQTKSATPMPDRRKARICADCFAFIAPRLSAPLSCWLSLLSGWRAARAMKTALPQPMTTKWSSRPRGAHRLGKLDGRVGR